MNVPQLLQSSILVSGLHINSFMNTQLKLMIEILERNKMITETANEQMKNYLTLSTEHLPDDYNDASNNNNESGQSKTLKWDSHL